MRRARREDAELGRAVVSAGVDAQQGAALVFDLPHPADHEDVRKAAQPVQGRGELVAEDELGLDLGPDAAGGVVDAVADDCDGGEVVDPLGQGAQGLLAGLGGGSQPQSLAPVGHRRAALSRRG